MKNKEELVGDFLERIFNDYVEGRIDCYTLIKEYNNVFVAFINKKKNSLEECGFSFECGV